MDEELYGIPKSMRRSEALPKHYFNRVFCHLGSTESSRLMEGTEHQYL